MIDLSREKKQKADEAPIGAVILALMPFAWAFWALIERGLR